MKTEMATTGQLTSLMFFALFLSMASSFFTTINGTLRKEPCLCKIDIKSKIADCSGLDIVQVSAILHCLPVSIKKLYLNNNNINDLLPGELSTFKLLQTLDVGNNKLHHLASGVFEGLTSLSELYLHRNDLQYNNSYPADVFLPLLNLQLLWINRNCRVAEVSCWYPDEALSVLSSLRHLRMDGIPNTDFGEGFSQLKNLTSLHFDNDDGYCNFQSLTSTSFASLRATTLSDLYIEECIVLSITPNVFRGLRNLTKLFVGDNQKLCANGIENATMGLNETNIQTLIFNKWCRDPPSTMILTEGMLSALTNTSLKNLIITESNIEYIDPSVVENIPLSLEYLSLKENSLRRGEFLKSLKRLDKLKTLDVSFQGHFHSNSSSVFTSQSFSTNQTIKFPNSEIYVVLLPKNLQTLYMNNINLGYPIPGGLFGPNSLRYLDASNCLLKGALGPVYGLNHIEVLNLSDNPFKIFLPIVLVGMANLKKLLLKNCELGNSLSNDRAGLTFSKQLKLEFLDLSENKIKVLPFSIFKSQFQLRTLLLAGNSLKSVNFSLTFMQKLEYLDLSNNQIEYFSNDNMDVLNNIASSTVLKINLSNNALSCKCDHERFINWLADTPVNILSKNQLECVYINGSVISLSKISDIRQQLKYDCSVWIAMTSCAVGFVGLLLLLSLIALFYHKRWQLRYLYYIGRKTLNPYHHPLEDEHVLINVDAYISYDQHYEVTSDLSLHRVVSEHLHPMLSEKGFNVKIREDLQGGKMLHDVISEVIRRTRKVVVLITPMYCKDFWNTFEFNMGAYEGIYTKRNVIVPVVVGEDTDIYFTPEIKSFILSKFKSNEVFHTRLSGDLEHEVRTLVGELEHSLMH